MNIIKLLTNKQQTHFGVPVDDLLTSAVRIEDDLFRQHTVMEEFLVVNKLLASLGTLCCHDEFRMLRAGDKVSVTIDPIGAFESSIVDVD